jgi:uncharacterized protein involved in exopolysaccharide biosynthesis
MMGQSLSPQSGRNTVQRGSASGESVTAVEGAAPILNPRLRVYPGTLRDFLAVLFRHKGLILISFFSVFAGAVLTIFLTPRQYESHMKILVKRERMDMVMAPDANSRMVSEPSLSQEDLNSEVELLRSSDLLEKVVLACGLAADGKGPSLFGNLKQSMTGGNSKEGMRVPRAVQNLAQNLSVEPISKSYLIDVRYKSPDAKLAAHVLQTLASLYLEKHLSVHRTPGALEFFQRQTNQYREKLGSAEQELARFGRKEGVLSIDIEKDIALRKLNDFETRLREAQSDESALDQRIKALQVQIAETPSRVRTQVRSSPNPYLLQELKTTLLNLGLKRTELLTKFEPGYRIVQEVDAQIAQAKAALADAEKGPIIDETTDLDQTRLWLDAELAKTEAERATVSARIKSFMQSVEECRHDVQQIGSKEVAYDDLSRTAKSAEENYMLYLKKQEEARIDDALDRSRIVNAAIAEAPVIPSLPYGPSRALLLVLAVMAASLTSMGLAFVADYMDPSFRTPDEVEALLDIPVLASFPQSRRLQA